MLIARETTTQCLGNEEKKKLQNVTEIEGDLRRAYMEKHV